jgi:(E)-4-hydroxy-3-methylbut-2-enyl-diphosphate synthase
VNSGSVQRDLLDKHGGPVPAALVESALQHVALCERYGFEAIVLSVKMTDVLGLVEAYRQLAARVDYPLHLGVTGAGLPAYGAIKSAVGLGMLLAEGLGDTLRVSLAGDPVEEVRVGRDILRSLGLLPGAVEVIACPSCGRTEIDFLALAEQVSRDLAGLKVGLRVAVMGCVVNGPGEARQADYGIAGGRGQGVIFRHGEVLKKVPEQDLADELRRIILADLEEQGIPFAAPGEAK